MADSDPQSVADAALGGYAAAALREWLDNRQAEIERDHRDGWTGRTCYCDSPKPCADRAYELTMIEGLRALLADRARMAAELEQVRGERDEDTRAVVAVARATGFNWISTMAAITALRERFADRIAVLTASAAPDATGDTQTAEKGSESP